MDDNAFRIYKLASQGYCCTQIMLKMALEDEDKENYDLIRTMHALCGGIGYTKKSCGAMLGGICILGLYAGKGSPSEFYNENFMKMIQEYMKWFEEDFESTECSDLIGVHVLTDENGNINYPVKCGDTLLKCYEKVQEILYKYGFEYGERENNE